MSEDGLLQGNMFEKNPVPGEKKTFRRGKGGAGKLLFSYSKMAMYQECPLRYKFKYVDKLPEKPKSYFALGHSVHSALEFFHSRLPVPPLEEIKSFFEKDWKLKNFLEKGYADEEKENQDLLKGLKILEKYHAKHGEERALPFLCEYKTYVDVDGVEVIIIADKIEYLGGGKIKIVDYKTGKPGKRNSDQLYMYQKISEADPLLKEKIAEKLQEKVNKVIVDSMLYYYVEPLKEVSFRRAADKEIGEFWERALGVVENINSAKFEANPGEFQCNFCDFKAHCPVFEGAFKKEPGIKKSSAGGELEKTALRYAELQEKLKKVKDEIAGCEKELDKFFREGVVSFENEYLKIKLEKKEKLEFKDRERIITLLKEGGVYEKTLKPTVQTILELLKDPEVGEDLKSEIKSSAKVSWQIISEISRKD